MSLPKAFLTEISFSGGQTIPLNKGDIVIIVGGNNSGKSTALKNILSYSRDSKPQKVITQTKMSFEGDATGFVEYAKAMMIQKGEYLVFGSKYIEKNQLEDHWPIKNGDIISNLFFSLLSTSNRLSSADSSPSFDASSESPSTPLQKIFNDDETEKRISNLFKQAFGKNLVIDVRGGQKISMHVTDDDALPYDTNRSTSEFTKRLRTYPKIDDEGDGMRSFVGILLHALTSQKSITLIDEPEAFLHPPQIRILAKTLATETPTDKQLIISTHSQDFINGILDSDITDRVKVTRIERDASVNNVSLLESAAVKELWSDPLLRYSNILSGLFHEHVILCEADMDCKFYQTILDHIVANAHIKQPDILFTHCGGKARMKNVIKALQAIKIPLSIICDIDVLNNEETIKSIVEAKGGNWEHFKPDWLVVYNDIVNMRPEISKSDLAQKLSEQISNISNETLTSEDIENLRKIIKKTSPWETIKSGGKAVIPSGNASSKFNSLNEKLERIGIFIVPVGEVECFDKTVGGHGNKWLTSVLQKEITNEYLNEAKTFVKNICLQSGIIL